MNELADATVVSSCEPCAMCYAVCTVAGVARIVYAAPKEFVPDLGRPPRPDLVAMQTALRGLAGNTVKYVPTPGADDPFTRFAAKGDEVFAGAQHPVSGALGRDPS